MILLATNEIKAYLNSNLRRYVKTLKLTNMRVAVTLTMRKLRLTVPLAAFRFHQIFPNSQRDFSCEFKPIARPSCIRHGD